MVNTVHMSLSLSALKLGEGRSIKKNFCGIEWEVEITLYRSTLEIVLWCNPDFLNSTWFCETYTAVVLSSTEGCYYADLANANPIREAVITFHSRNRSHLFVISRSALAEAEQTMAIVFEIRSIVSYSNRQSRYTAGFIEHPVSCTDLSTFVPSTPCKLGTDNLSESISNNHNFNFKLAELQGSSAQREQTPASLCAEDSHVELATPSRVEGGDGQREEVPSSNSDQNCHLKAVPPSVEQKTDPLPQPLTAAAVEDGVVEAEALFMLEERITQLEKTSTAAVEKSNVERAMMRDLRTRIAQLEYDSAAAVESSNVEAAVLRELEARIAQIENGKNAKTKSSKISRLWRAGPGRLINAQRSSTLSAGTTPHSKGKPNAKHTFSEALAFKTFHSNNLETSETIAVGHDNKKFSLHEIFHDISLQPYLSLESVTYSFAKHFCTKLFEGRMAPSSISHFPCERDALHLLVEQIASAIICGYNFEEQLRNDIFKIKELRSVLEKQLHTNFENILYDKEIRRNLSCQVTNLANGSNVIKSTAAAPRFTSRIRQSTRFMMSLKRKTDEACPIDLDEHVGVFIFILKTGEGVVHVVPVPEPLAPKGRKTMVDTIREVIHEVSMEQLDDRENLNSSYSRVQESRNEYMVDKPGDRNPQQREERAPMKGRRLNECMTDHREAPLELMSTKRRHRPGALALKEIRRLEKFKSTCHLIPKAAEAHLVRMFGDALSFAFRTNRDIVKPKDIRIVRKLQRR